jgi:hypothetical protein
MPIGSVEEKAATALIERWERIKTVTTKLRNIHKATKALERTTFVDNDLEHLGIRVSHLELEGDHRGGQKLFYEPLTVPEVRDIKWQDMQFLPPIRTSTHEQIFRVGINLDNITSLYAATYNKGKGDAIWARGS